MTHQNPVSISLKIALTRGRRERDSHLGLFDHWICHNRVPCTTWENYGSLFFFLFFFLFLFLVCESNHLWHMSNIGMVDSLTIPCSKDYALLDFHKDLRFSSSPPQNATLWFTCLIFIPHTHISFNYRKINSIIFLVLFCFWGLNSEDYNRQKKTKRTITKKAESSNTNKTSYTIGTPSYCGVLSQ